LVEAVRSKPKITSPSVLEWPGTINPIENLSLIIKKVASKPPKNIVELKNAIMEVWVKEVDQDATDWWK